ncbi:glycosyltransferase [Vibrio maerlii]|uniref:glycosyltransferase n=1 Tax=Vibrio maerlii TaxID=2231648 RepID=UPI0013DED4E1|nr:glycosyltransferase [Vibrio maerlii]
MKDVSVIVRYHNKGDFDLLKNALFSLCIQGDVTVTPLIILHNCEENIIREIKEYISFLSSDWAMKKRFVIENINDDSDIRSTMLNRGIALNESRYLAFLDYDDVIYNGAYEYLLERLEKTNTAFSAGGCRKATFDVSGRYNYCESKVPFLNFTPNIFYFLVDNFLPIHSYMIDTHMVKQDDLYFDESLCALEDYELLIRLVSKYRMDLKGLDHFVCEYRIRNDETHTTPFHDLSLIDGDEKWSHGRSKISELLGELKFELSLKELKELI